MADNIKISLPYGYKINKKDIAETKKWMLKRNDNAMYLADAVEALIDKALMKIVSIAYSYNMKPEKWHLTAINERFKEIEEIMDALEVDLYDTVLMYSIEDKGSKDKLALLAWLILLHSKNTKNLRQTLHARLYQFLFDTEAQIASMMLAGKDKTEAILRIISTKYAVYSSAEVMSAFNKKSEAKYIKTKGVHHDNIGLSSSGALNVVNFAKQTAILGWMHKRIKKYQREGVAGFYVLRGSLYPCDICDSHVGFRKIDEADAYPPFHAHCQCYAIPVYQMTQQELIKSQIE